MMLNVEIQIQPELSYVDKFLTFLSPKIFDVRRTLPRNRPLLCSVLFRAGSRVCEPLPGCFLASMTAWPHALHFSQYP